MTYQIDPRHPGTVMRYFLIAEAVANTVEGVYFILAPMRFLRFFLADGTVITPAHENLFRVFALVLLFMITPMTALATKQTPSGIEGRKLLCIGYALVEGFGISFFLWTSWIGPEKSGFDPDATRFVVKQLLLPFFGRFIPMWRPQYYGRYTFVEKWAKKKQ